MYFTLYSILIFCEHLHEFFHLFFRLSHQQLLTAISPSHPNGLELQKEEEVTYLIYPNDSSYFRRLKLILLSSDFGTYDLMFQNV